ncbi:MAG: DUF1850 domain-containing protein [Geminicoccaceae bacterium]|nr:DUF1850 domain-containing protein [Geminicoccaceae bacterium]
MSVCLGLGALVVALEAERFTLAWTHSVEHTRWEEDWRAADGRLVLEAARVQGSGAGMEVPDGAIRRGAFWQWHPDLPPQDALTLGRSAAVPPYTLCVEGACRSVDAILGDPSGEDPARLWACPGRE